MVGGGREALCECGIGCAEVLVAGAGFVAGEEAPGVWDVDGEAVGAVAEEVGVGLGVWLGVWLGVG